MIGSRRFLGLLDLGFGRRLGAGRKKQDQTQDSKNSHLLLLSDATPRGVNFYNRMTMPQSPQGPPLQGKISIVTGASRGIGHGIALRLAAAGSSVVLCARDQQLLDTAVAQIRSAGGTAEAISLDLRVPDSGQRAVEFAIERFGRIDILVNNAGATKRGEFLELTDDDFADGFALKYFGSMRLTRACLAAPQSRVRIRCIHLRRGRADAGSAVRHRRIGQRSAAFAHQGSGRSRPARRGAGQRH